LQAFSILPLIINSQVPQSPNYAIVFQTFIRISYGSKGQVGKNTLYFHLLLTFLAAGENRMHKLGTVCECSENSANALGTPASPVINFHTCSIHYCADFLPGNGFDWFAIDCDLADVRSLDDTNLNDGGVECIHPVRRKRGTTPNPYLLQTGILSLS